jgi:polysaccharide biosynthesis/export protein
VDGDRAGLKLPSDVRRRRTVIACIDGSSTGCGTNRKTLVSERYTIMEKLQLHPLRLVVVLLVSTSLWLVSCASSRQQSPPLAKQTVDVDYVIAPGDTLAVFVWANPDLTIVNVPVRPDGKITTPLAEDVKASGKTSTQLARDIEEKLSRFVKRPDVTVTVTAFEGRYGDKVRVVGEATRPQSFPYREGMTALDAVIAVGGLTEYAGGNKAKLVRSANGKQNIYGVRLDDLVRDGDVSANVDLLPGDVLIIPEASWF